MEQMVANMVEIAKSPKHPHAFVALCDRAYGRPKPSEEELDANAEAKSGLVVVYVDRPFLLPDVPIVDAKDLERQPRRRSSWMNRIKSVGVVRTR
jgi:hypothetical protein